MYKKAGNPFNIIKGKSKPLKQSLKMIDMASVIFVQKFK